MLDNNEKSKILLLINLQIQEFNCRYNPTYQHIINYLAHLTKSNLLELHDPLDMQRASED